MALKAGQIEQCFCEREETIKESVNEIFNITLEFGVSEKLIVTNVNKLLSVAKTRPKGFAHLNECLDHCSIACLNENALLWANYCLIQLADDKLKEIKLRTLAKIIDSAYETVPDFNKKFVSDCLPKIIDPIIATKNNVHEISAAFNCLTVCLKRYPGWFNPVVKKIDNYVLKFLDNVSVSSQEAAFAAHTFLYLQQVGAGGLDGINHINSFASKFRMLCVTVHDLFDDLYSNKTTVDLNRRETMEVSGHKFNELPTTYDEVKTSHVAARRVLNCLTFLKVMIEKKYPVPKQIKPAELLSLIKRGLITQHSCVCAENVRTDDLHLGVLTKRIQIELLKLLRSFIFWARSNLLPYSFTVDKMLLEALAQTHKCSCFSVDCVYQETVYKVLGEWIKLSKCAIHRNFQEDLINEILVDVVPIKNQVCLTIQSDKKQSKKSKNKAIHDRIISSGETNTTYSKLTRTRRSVEETNALFALRTLKSLFQSTHIELSSQLLQKLYAAILRVLLDVQAGRPVHPYLNPDCQTELYGLLVSFYDQDSIEILPPLDTAVHVLNGGCASFNRNVSIACCEGLNALEKLCQPISHPFISSSNNTESREENETRRSENTPERENIKTVSILSVDIVQTVSNSEGDELNETDRIASDDSEQFNNREEGIGAEISQNSYSEECNDENGFENGLEFAPERSAEETTTDIIKLLNDQLRDGEENEPPLKKIKSEEIDIEDDMLDSFVDEVNY